MRALAVAGLWLSVLLGLPSAGRAAAAVAQDDSPAAYRCLLEAEQTRGDFAGFLAALRAAVTALAPLGNAAVDELIAYPRKYWEEGDLAHANEAFSVLVTAFPGSEKAQSGYGTVLVTQGRLDEARKHFSLALEIAPRDPMVLHNAALAATLALSFTEARQYYERLIELEPENTAHTFDLATLALADGPAAAVPAWRRYLAQNAEAPDDPGIAEWAKSELKTLERNPTPHDLDDLASALIRAQMGIEAIPGLVGLAQRDPTDPLHHFLLAQAYDDNHLPQLALAELRTTESLLRAHPAFEGCLHAKEASRYVEWCQKNAAETAPDALVLPAEREQ